MEFSVFKMRAGLKRGLGILSENCPGRGQRVSYQSAPPRWLKKAIRHLQGQHLHVNGSDTGFLLELVAIFGEMVVVYARWRSMATLCLDMVSEHVELVLCGSVCKRVL